VADDDGNSLQMPMVIWSLLTFAITFQVAIFDTERDRLATWLIDRKAVFHTKFTSTLGVCIVGSTYSEPKEVIRYSMNARALIVRLNSISNDKTKLFKSERQTLTNVIECWSHAYMADAFTSFAVTIIYHADLSLSKLITWTKFIGHTTSLGRAVLN